MLQLWLSMAPAAAALAASGDPLQKRAVVAVAGAGRVVLFGDLRSPTAQHDCARVVVQSHCSVACLLCLL